MCKIQFVQLITIIATVFKIKFGGLTESVQ